MNRYLSFDRLFGNLGGWYLMMIVAIVQVLALLGAVPGYVSIQLNLASNPQQSQALSALIPVLYIVGFLVMFFIIMRITPTARKRLDEIANNKGEPNQTDSFEAWREITSLTWRYGVAAVLVGMICIVFPAAFISLIISNSQPTSLPSFLSSISTMYVLMGGTAAVLGYAILAIFLIGRLTLQVRLILAPKDFETQLKGRSGALVTSKFLIMIVALIIISLFLIIPIGFQQTSRIILADATPMEVLRDFQTDAIFFSALVLVLGIAYSYYASRSVSDPVRDLIETFDRIEAGDLSARAPISATDELGIVTMQFNRMVARLESLQNSLEQQVLERTKQLSATNEVGRVASSSLDPNEMLVRVVNLFTEQFSYYFASVYLLDSSGKWAELREATGDAGKTLVQNHHRVEVTGKNLIGSAIRERTPRVEHNTMGRDAMMQSSILPYTRSEIALPLIVGDRVFGALDIHSRKELDFNPDIISNLQNMAGQVAIALENARLFQEAQQNIYEMRAIQQQYLLTGWSDMSNQPEELEYGVGDSSESSAVKVDVPISLRDQKLGEIHLENPETWTPEQENLVNAIATQAAIALENARLVSESRQIAIRERMLAEINSRIWSSATIDGVLQTVVKELGRRLDASRATIELDVEEIK